MDKLEEFIPIESNFDILKAELGMRGVSIHTVSVCTVSICTVNICTVSVSIY